MRKQNYSSSRSLGYRQLTPDELVRLFHLVVDGANTIFYVARWDSKEEATGDSLADLDRIEDAEELRRVELLAWFEDSQQLTFIFHYGHIFLSWKGNTAGENARKIEYRWTSLPGRTYLGVKGSTRLSTCVVILQIVLGIALAVVPSIAKLFIFPFWVLCLALLVLFFLEVGPFAVERVTRRPVVLNRPRSVWKDPRFVVPSAISFLSLLALTTACVVGILTYINK